MRLNALEVVLVAALGHEKRLLALEAVQADAAAVFFLLGVGGDGGGVPICLDYGLDDIRGVHLSPL